MIHKRKSINTEFMFFLLAVSAVMSSISEERFCIYQLGFEFVFAFEFCLCQVIILKVLVMMRAWEAELCILLVDNGFWSFHQAPI